MRGRARTLRTGLLTIGACAAVATAGPAFAQDVFPDDFGAVAKNTKTKQLDKNTVLYKESLKSGGARIGKAKLKVTFADRVKINAVWRLDDGTIQAKGKVQRQGDKSIATIVDGTAAYKGARGKVTFEPITERRRREEFDFR
jgi:hypothetical protein